MGGARKKKTIYTVYVTATETMTKHGTLRAAIKRFRVERSSGYPSVVLSKETQSQQSFTIETVFGYFLDLAYIPVDKNGRATFSRPHYRMMGVPEPSFQLRGTKTKAQRHKRKP